MFLTYILKRVLRHELLLRNAVVAALESNVRDETVRLLIQHRDDPTDGVFFGTPYLSDLWRAGASGKKQIIGSALKCQLPIPLVRLNAAAGCLGCPTLEKESVCVVGRISCSERSYPFPVSNPHPTSNFLYRHEWARTVL